MNISQAPYVGRPTDERIPKEARTYDFLDSLGVEYTRADHNAAATIEDCLDIEKVLGTKICKNLLLCNQQKTKFYLLMMPGDKKFKTKELSSQINSARLSFAGPEDMVELLGVHPGSVTVLGLMNDKAQKVQLVMDKPIYEAANVACHPCISTSTLCFSRQDLMEKLLPAMDHSPIVVDLPDPEEE